MEHKIHIVTDAEDIYYQIDWEVDTSDLIVEKEKTIQVSREELCHILALQPLWRGKYLEDKLNDE